MVMEATAKVIESDELLGKFGINEVFWPYIRHSWSNHQLFLCGRFDLGFDGKSMKLLEYNADSAGLVAETSVIQNIWAEATGSAIGKSGGDSIHSILVESWKKLSQGRKVHIFVDHSELEEIYMEKYYGMVLKDAGIEFKDENRISEIRVTETGVIDKDGEIIQVIWKVWNWNTICRRFFEKGEDRKLADIMLYPSVTVVEPFWKIISSSKALLPVIWDLFGNHPLLLRAEFQLSDEMADGKYVSKPISGRLGENVNVFQNGKIVEGSEGSLAQVESVFQKFFQLPEFDDGFHAILGSWVIGEAGSGIIVREHQTLITGFYSPVISCRIVASQ
jgi:glutathionylspermidine amidase/synthetase